MPSRPQRQTFSLLGVGSLLDGVRLLLVHGAEDGDNELLPVIVHILNLFCELFRVLVAGGELEILTSVTLVRHEGKEALVVDGEEGVVQSLHERHLKVVGRRDKLLHLLAGEDVGGGEMALGVAVLPSLGGGHLNNLGGAALDAHEATLADGTSLHRVGGGRAGIGGLEGLHILFVSHVALSLTKLVCRAEA